MYSPRKAFDRKMRSAVPVAMVESSNSESEDGFDVPQQQQVVVASPRRGRRSPAAKRAAVPGALQRDPSTGRYLPRGTSAKRSASPPTAVRRRVAVEVVTAPQVEVSRKTRGAAVASPKKADLGGRRRSPRVAAAVAPAVAAPPARRASSPTARVTFINEAGEPAVEKPKRGRRAMSQTPAESAAGARATQVLRSSYCRTDSQWSDAEAEAVAQPKKKASPRRAASPRKMAAAVPEAPTRAASPGMTSRVEISSKRDYAHPSLGATSPKAPASRRGRRSVDAAEQGTTISSSTSRRVRKMSTVEAEAPQVIMAPPQAPVATAPVSAVAGTERLACAAPAAPAAAVGNSSDMLWSYLNAA